MPKARLHPKINYLGHTKKHHSLYHALLQLPIPAFLLLFFTCFFLINCSFASLYLITHGLVNATQPLTPVTFGDSLYFSMTFPIVGYGGITPNDIGKIIASIHVFGGLVFLGTLTGIIFARFTQAPSPLIWSTPLVLAHKGSKSFLKLRITNVIGNDVIGVTPEIYLQRINRDTQGILHRELIPIKLDRERIPVLAFSWILSHQITKNSPLQSWLNGTPPETERLVGFIHGYDATLHRDVYSYARWHPNNLLCGEFAEVITAFDEDERLKVHATLDLSKIDKVIFPLEK